MRLLVKRTTAVEIGDAELVEPGLVWGPLWRPEPDDPQDFAEDPRLSCVWAGIGKLS